MSEPTRPPAGRSARIGSVAAGYLGVSWLILQVIDVIKDIVRLPSWLAPGALVVLAIGFVVMIATAWIQADPDTTRREQAGELPGDWQIAPREAWAALSRGRLPHLTWGRSILGGVVALSLLFGVSGAYVLFANRSAAADPSAGIRVAAMPFTTNGANLDVYREGMVELLATNLDGLGGIRSIASRTVLARWDDLAGSETRPDLDAVLATAKATGASHALVGSIVAAGDEVRLTAQLFDLATRAELQIPRVEGHATDILALVDGLSVSVVRALLGSDEEIKTSGSRLASLTTASVPALRLYLQAEALYRRNRFAEAEPLLEQALAADSTFGLALVRRAQALGWDLTTPRDTLAAARRAIRPHLGTLSQRDAVIAEAGIIDFADRNAKGVRMLRDFVSRYPDDAEGRFQLSDFLFHLNDIRGGAAEEVLGGFDGAVELAPRFAPYYVHAIEVAFFEGDSSRTRQLMTRYRALAGEDARWTQWTLAHRVMFGAASLPDIRAGATAVFGGGLRRLTTMSEHPEAIADLAARYLAADTLRITALLRAGRWSTVRTESASLPDSIRLVVQQKALAWVGAFGLDRAQTPLIWDGPLAVVDPGFFTADPAAQLKRLLAARDDGTGANPVLLAHTALLANDSAAEQLLIEESWREFGPAMHYRLAQHFEATSRPAQALQAYRKFLSLWRGADQDLPPVKVATDAIQRLASK